MVEAYGKKKYYKGKDAGGANGSWHFSIRI